MTKEPQKQGNTAKSFAMSISGEQLKSYMQRLESLEEEKTQLNEQIKEVYGEAKGNGFDTKAIKHILRLRKQDPDDLREQEAILELYKQALGMETKKSSE